MQGFEPSPKSGAPIAVRQAFKRPSAEAVAHERRRSALTRLADAAVEIGRQIGQLRERTDQLAALECTRPLGRDEQREMAQLRRESRRLYLELLTLRREFGALSDDLARTRGKT